jgi:hypothetical protein
MPLKNVLACVAVVAVAVQLGACNACDHPASATYSNPPGPSGSAGCPGLPVSKGGNPGDVDHICPIGTVVSLPFCSGAYPDEDASCTCTTGLQFGCPK